MRTVDDVQPDELRKRAEEAREAIESGDPARLRQAQLDLEALAQEAEKTEAKAQSVQDARTVRIREGKGVGFFAEAVGSLILLGGVIAVIAGVVWSFNNSLTWVGDLLALAGIFLVAWLIYAVVVGFIKGLFVFGSALRFGFRKRPRAVARARKKHQRIEAARKAAEEKALARAETVQKVRDFDLQSLVIGKSFRLLDFLWVWSLITVLRVVRPLDRNRRRGVRFPKAREVVAVPHAERRQFFLDAMETTPEPEPKPKPAPPEAWEPDLTEPETPPPVKSLVDMDAEEREEALKALIEKLTRGES